MKRSSAPAPISKAESDSSPPGPLDLQFPIDPEFVSRPPRLDPQIMLQRCAQNMAWRNSRPGAKERRLAEKISVEFVL